MYSTNGLIPEWLIERLVAKRLWTGPQTARSIEPEPDTAPIKSEDARYLSGNQTLLPENPESTVGNVVDWQILHHKGFVPAFISSIRYAPVHNQHHRWRRLREHIEQGNFPKQVHIVLGAKDPVIVAEEVTEDVKEVLGKRNLKFKVFGDVGHEVGIEKAEEIAGLVAEVLKL